MTARLLDQTYHDYLLGLDRDTPIVFQCHHGIRSQSAAEYFLSHGFRRVFNLSGGIQAGRSRSIRQSRRADVR
jgi:monothiol glutaredoxin